MKHVINATEFKAKCLDLLDQVSSGALPELEITKRGQVVGRLVPPRKRPACFTEWQDSMRGRVHIPQGFDLTAPVCEDQSEAEFGRLPW